MRDPADALREREFDECEQGAFGWDGYHTEDGVAFARMFRRQRDAAEARVAELKADRDTQTKVMRGLEAQVTHQATRATAAEARVARYEKAVADFLEAYDSVGMGWADVEHRVPALRAALAEEGTNG